jgi:hypothetical protein
MYVVVYKLTHKEVFIKFLKTLSVNKKALCFRLGTIKMMICMLGWIILLNGRTVSFLSVFWMNDANTGKEEALGRTEIPLFI